SLVRAVHEAAGLPFALLTKHAHRHPFTSHDEVDATIVVVIDPSGGGDHARSCEPRGSLARHVAEVTCAVVLQQIARRRRPVGARNGTPANEEVWMAVAIEVSNDDT